MPTEVKEVWLGTTSYTSITRGKCERGAKVISAACYQRDLHRLAEITSPDSAESRQLTDCALRLARCAIGD